MGQESMTRCQHPRQEEYFPVMERYQAWSCLKNYHHYIDLRNLEDKACVELSSFTRLSLLTAGEGDAAIRPNPWLTRKKHELKQCGQMKERQPCFR
jgi:hypothetical protein